MTTPKPEAQETDRPRPAATLIVVDRRRGEPRVLMGRRRPDVVFLPNKYVFPGGRLEAADARIATRGALAPDDAARLMRGLKGPGREGLARAFPVAAVRETYEETGLLIAGAGLEGFSDQGPGWPDLVAAGLEPDLSQLRYAARAITPPGRPRRFDTRFFIAEAASIGGPAGRTDGELSGIGWFTLHELQTLDLPSVTRLVLGDLSGNLSGEVTRGIPFYFWRAGAFRRAFLSQTAGSA